MDEPRAKAPWHLWVVGVISLLWYASGAFVLLQAQYRTWPGMPADEAAYYAARPVYLELLTDLALASTVTGSIALLLRSRFSIQLFQGGMVVILLSNGIEIGNGTSRVYANIGALVATGVIVVWAIFDWLYAWTMHRRGVLG